MKRTNANHVCRNANCHKGINGGRKEYYACNSCVKDKPTFWQAYCCSIECYQEYMLNLEKQKAGQAVKEPTTVEILEQAPVEDLVDAIIAKTDEAIAHAGEKREEAEPVAEEGFFNKARKKRHRKQRSAE